LRLCDFKRVVFGAVSRHVADDDRRILVIRHMRAPAGRSHGNSALWTSRKVMSRNDGSDSNVAWMANAEG
jgi:hypothetical protein